MLISGLQGESDEEVLGMLEDNSSKKSFQPANSGFGSYTPTLGFGSKKRGKPPAVSSPSTPKASMGTGDKDRKKDNQKTELEYSDEDDDTGGKGSSNKKNQPPPKSSSPATSPTPAPAALAPTTQQAPAQAPSTAKDMSPQ